MREPAEGWRSRRQISDAPRGEAEERAITPPALQSPDPLQVLLACSARDAVLRPPFYRAGCWHSQKIHECLLQGHPFSRWSLWDSNPLLLDSHMQPAPIWLLSYNLWSRGGAGSIQRGSAHPWSCGSRNRVNSCPGGCRGSFFPGVTDRKQESSQTALALRLCESEVCAGAGPGRWLLSRCRFCVGTEGRCPRPCGVPSSGSHVWGHRLGQQDLCPRCLCRSWVCGCSRLGD